MGCAGAWLLGSTQSRESDTAVHVFVETLEVYRTGQRQIQDRAL